MKRLYLEKIIWFVIVFTIVLTPSLYVPIQSDDYSYFLMGLSPSAHYHHYMTWSGRLITNIISTMLLSSMPHFAYEIINTIAFSLLILFIVAIPLTEKGDNKLSYAIRVAFTFTLYWIANPNLGQTSFWIVGSANYLWTNMFIAFYFVYFFRILNKQHCNKAILFILAFLAGASNENTGLVVVILTVFLSFYERTSAHIKSISIVGNVLGFLLLILAPGNHVRASHFEYWNSLGFIQKIYIHFFERFPKAISEYWQVYIVMIAALLVASLSGTLRKNTIIYMTVFFIASILANAAFLGSPVLPPRALNGGLCFLLISMSFVLVDALKNDGIFERYFIYICGAFCIFYFLPSYYLFNVAMHTTTEQAQIREDIIINEKNNGIMDVKIPRFYFPKLAKSSDKFDTFHSHSMAKYYGVKSISPFPIEWDYSQINKAKNIDVNLSFYKDYKLERIYFYSESMGMKKKNMTLLEFSGPIDKAAESGDKIFMHIYKKGDKNFINADVDVSPIAIDGRYFTARGINNVKSKDIEKIIIGIYNTKTKKRKFEYLVTP